MLSGHPLDQYLENVRLPSFNHLPVTIGKGIIITVKQPDEVPG